nr:transporter substrate-binding domain-containing protein [uncultured Roseateles sp.]
MLPCRSFLLLLCLSAASAWAQHNGATGPTLRACGHPAAPPMSWDQDGQLTGVCVAAARRAFAAVGLRLQVEGPTPWARCLRMVESGEVDVNLCGFVNDKRLEHAVMVEPPVGHNEAVLIVRRDSALVYKSWADLNGLRIGMGRGVSFGEEFDSYLAQNTQFDTALSEAHNLQKLLLGRLDAVVTARHAGQQQIRATGCETQLRILPGKVVDGPLFMQMSKRSKHLSVIPQLTAFLKQPAQIEWAQGQQARFETMYAQLHPPAQPKLCER